MKVRSLSRDFSCAACITVEDVSTIKALGIQSIICNRPDGEDSDQTSFDDISKAAEAQGIKTVYVPLAKGKIPEMEVKAFAKALNELPYPALAYCASGTRSAALWASVKAETLGKDQVIAISKDAGFDIARIVPTFATDPSI